MPFLSLAAAAAATNIRVDQHVLTDGWSVAERTTGNVNFTIAVKQQNFDKLASITIMK